MTSEIDEGARYEFVLHLMEALFYDTTAGRSFALQQLRFEQVQTNSSWVAEGTGASEQSDLIQEGLWTIGGCRGVLHDLSEAVVAGVKKLSLSIMPRTEPSAQRQLLLLDNEYYRNSLVQHFARWSLVYVVRHKHVKDALANVRNGERENA